MRSRSSRRRADETATGARAGAREGRLSRTWNRRRRLRRTLGALLAVVAIAVVAGWIVYRRSQPRIHRPGEELADISSRLALGPSADAPEPRFVDVTETAGLAGFRSFAGERSSQIPEDMGGGVAFGDFDGDGDDDLFLVAAGGPLGLPAGGRAPSELYENLGDGSFRRAAGFPELRILGMAAAWGDADGDGRPDLVVSGYRALELYLNRGGRFEPAPDFPSPDGYWSGLAWGDFDGDGDLDLYVCGYVRYREDAADRARSSKQFGTEAPYTLNPASYDPEPNLLLENDGTGRFTEVAARWGIDDPEGRSLAAVWHDFDGDGRLDLYVANDISDNALFLNRGDWFEDASHAARVADYRGAMGLAIGDWNRDGDDDLFITHWLAQENALYDSRLADSDSEARGGTGGAPEPRRPAFMDLSSPLGLGQVALPYVGWGVEFADFDGDGWLDLAVANGSTLELQGAPPRLEPQPPFLFWNRRGEHFVNLAPAVPALAQPRVGRGLAVSDVDRDGDLDLLLVDHDGGALLLRNDMQRGHWLEVDLRDRPRREGSGAAGAEGATAVAHIGDLTLRRSIVGGASYLSQSTRTLHFGLGEANRIDRLEVRWPDGEVDLFEGLDADARWEIRRGEGAPRRLTAGGGEAGPGRGLGERERVVEFWKRHRAGMDAMKRRGDLDAAIASFRGALELDPRHGDARYYLANCLAARGETDAALSELAELVRIDPGSHRGHKQWGVLRAATARTPEDLAAARKELERALELNREETGSLLALGELALLEGRENEAERVLALATRTNPRAVGGFFLRAWLASKRGDDAGARELLGAARAALGPDWKPRHAAAEGDVAAKMHVESGPLDAVWEGWDGAEPAPAAFTGLERLLAERRQALSGRGREDGIE